MHVLVVDDHPLILEGIAQLLPQLAPGIAVRLARDRAEAEAALDNDPDIVLMLLDLALPETRGLDFLADLKLDYPGVDVVIVSATHDRATVMAALAAGARGFIAKTANTEVLASALRQVLAGEMYIPPDDCLLAQASCATLPPSELGLTMRETDVAELLAQGRPNKLICRELGLSEGTVKVHVSSILKKLRVQTRAQVVAELARRGISAETLAARR